MPTDYTLFEMKYPLSAANITPEQGISRGKMI